jgi:uncharacterized protein (TIGR02453 family)
MAAVLTAIDGWLVLANRHGAGMVRDMAKTTMAAARFTGFPKGGVDFFRALALKQDRTWFQAHKADYQALWEAPMHAFLHALKAPLSKAFPDVMRTTPKVFRIYRDTRFSKDKSPYKTYASAVVPLYPGGMMERVGLYFELGPSPFVASGRWMMEPPVLKRFRRAVAEEALGASFARAVERHTAQGFVVSSQKQLKRVPRPWTKDHPREALLRHTGFAYTFPTPSQALTESVELVRWTVDHVRRLAPVLKWVEAAARGRRPSLQRA